MQWFNLLNKFFKVKGKAQILFKLKGKNTTDIAPDEAKQKLIDGLRSKEKAYIYHCWNHYMCPIGFELTPKNPFNAYCETIDLVESSDFWVIIGEVSKCYPVFHTKRWEDIVTDLNCDYPEFFNIRKSELGVQKKENATKQGGNLHCIIEFSKVSD